MTTADRDLVHVVAAQSLAIRGLAEQLGVSITGMPELPHTFDRAASLEELHAHHRAVQVAFDQITAWMQSLAESLAEVLGRPPVVVEVPAPIVNANIVMPEQPATFTFRRDRDGRIVSAEKVPE